jgi:hypothetical protein
MADSPPRRALPPTARLIAELDAAARSPVRDLTRLQEAVCEYTQRMRDDGHSVERVQAAVKELALGRNLRAAGDAGGEHLVESIVRWCVSAYQEVG